jgi:hypothetical protein
MDHFLSTRPPIPLHATVGVVVWGPRLSFGGPGSLRNEAFVCSKADIKQPVSLANITGVPCPSQVLPKLSGH